MRYRQSRGLADISDIKGSTYKYLACILILCLQACHVNPPVPNAADYFPNKRVLFLGNSITHNGMYVSFIEYFLQQQFPDWELDIISIGLGSETVSCLTENDHPFPRPCLKDRLHQAMEKVKPDVVIACYGMNDGIYHPPDEARLKAYQKGIRHLIQTTQAASASLVLLTPPPFDPQPVQDRLVGLDAEEFGYKYPYEKYDDVLVEYAEWLQTIASPEIPVIDWHSAINQQLRQMRITDPKAGFSQDGIHPSAEGHLFMAKTFLQAFGIEPPTPNDWESLSQDIDFQRVHDRRRMRSSGWLSYVGYTRGERVASISPKPILMLMGGQSNMVGKGKKEELENASIPEQVSFINVGLGGKLKQDIPSFGPEISLSKVLAKAYPQQPFILLKCAVGGSSLLDWAPDYSKEKAAITGNPQFGSLYELFFRKIDSIRELYDPEIAALLWMQGERDARVPEVGADYQQNLTHFITAFRSRIGQENLPFVMGIVNPPLTYYPAVHSVQQAQRALAQEDPEVYAFETLELSKWKDDLHYDTQGQWEVGVKFGRILLKIIKDHGSSYKFRNK